MANFLHFSSSNFRLVTCLDASASLPVSFQQEEVRYLESELENQKQKYYKLQMFTKNLLSAVKNMDQEKQQVGTLSRALDQCGVTVTRQGNTLGRMPVCVRAHMHYG